MQNFLQKGSSGFFKRKLFLNILKYFCPHPDIDSSTQAAVGCTVNHTVEGKLACERTWSFASYMQGFLDCSLCSLLGERVKSSVEIH